MISNSFITSNESHISLLAFTCIFIQILTHPPIMITKFLALFSRKQKNLRIF